MVQEELAAAMEQSRKPVVVGPHWIVCAQVHAGLGRDVPVGCRTKLEDDFDRWYPRAEWEKAGTILYVKDDRFTGEEVAKVFPTRDIVSVRSAKLYRGGRAARTVQLYRLEGTGTAAR